MKSYHTAPFRQLSSAVLNTNSRMFSIQPNAKSPWQRKARGLNNPTGTDPITTPTNYWPCESFSYSFDLLIPNNLAALDLFP